MGVLVREHITPLLTALAADTKLLKLNISGMLG